MKKRIMTLLFSVIFFAGMIPLSAKAATGFDAWAGWEILDIHDDPTYPYTSYNAPFQDASFDEIVYCIANVLAEYIPTTNTQNTWQNSRISFKYTCDETLDAVMNTQENTILGVNNNRFTDTIILFNNRVLNHTGIGNSALFNVSGQHSNTKEITISFGNSMIFGENVRQKQNEARQKLMEIVNEAKAYSSTDYGRLEYINKYLIDNVRYSNSNPNGDWGQSTYEALVLGTAVCGGYTAAVQDLCFLLGIPSISLHGRNHIWNCVYIDGQWKMLDVTWNDSTGREKAYFLVDSITGDAHDFWAFDNIDRIEIVKDFVLKVHSKIEYVIVGGRPIPPAEAPSSWAVQQINTAISAGLVPQSLQTKYTQTITRAEYCALAVAFYEKYTGEEITERKSFNDTDDVNVAKMAAVGVVSGIGNNLFDPNANLTREQAAVMLSRLAEAIGKPLPKQAATFSDNTDISLWAFENVGQMQAAGIMGGIGNNTFAPKDPYTREQSIITMIRLWNIVN